MMDRFLRVAPMFLFIISGTLALAGQNGWGWFLAVAVLLYVKENS